MSANSAKLAKLVYDLLAATKQLRETGAADCGTPPALPGIDLVRPPNAQHGHAVAVLFADGRDVVIRFEEQGGE